MPPSCQPTVAPSARPSAQPSVLPTAQPSGQPLSLPTGSPSSGPSLQPSIQPSTSPTSWQPTRQPLSAPTSAPSFKPSSQPTTQPSVSPTTDPSRQPSSSPSSQPSTQPSSAPTNSPTTAPSAQPSTQPSSAPTMAPWKLDRHNAFPSNHSISVLSDDFQPFRITLPFLRTTVRHDDGFYDVNISSAPLMASAATGTVLLGSRNASEVGLQSTTIANFLSFDSTGRSVANAGDVNGDGIVYLIIGVPSAGVCYVLYGTAQGFVGMKHGFVIIGAAAGDNTGWAVAAAGDVNGDGLDDIVIGAPNARRGAGSVYVIYGRYRERDDVYLGALAAEDGVGIYGANPQDACGMSVDGAGDVNGGGRDDIVFGCLRIISSYSGGAYLIRDLLSPIALSALQEAQGVFLPGSAFSWSGYSVAGVGDVNGDGFADVLVGSAPWRGRYEAQSSYLILGNTTVCSRLLVYCGMLLQGGGEVVSGMGDVNDDGLADMLLVEVQSFTGQALVLHSPQAIAFPSVSPTSAPAFAPSIKPSKIPTTTPLTAAPSATAVPSSVPTAPTCSPTELPTGPSAAPTDAPTAPTIVPTAVPTKKPSRWPSISPTELPTTAPTFPSSHEPTTSPISRASRLPTNVDAPTIPPSAFPSKSNKSVYRTRSPTLLPTPQLVTIANDTARVQNGGNITLQDGVRVYVVNSSLPVSLRGRNRYPVMFLTLLAETILGIMQVVGFPFEIMHFHWVTAAWIPGSSRNCSSQLEFTSSYLWYKTDTLVKEYCTPINVSNGWQGDPCCEWYLN